MVEEAPRRIEIMRASERTFRLARRLRRELSLPEAILWRHLRRDQLDGLRFRRQHPFGPYVLDFYCPSARLAVEVDGAAHDFADRAAGDERRDAWLADRGVCVLRFMAADVLDDERLEGVLLMIADVAAAPSTASRSPSPADAGEDPRTTRDASS